VYKRKLVIGGIVGVLIFTIVSSIGASTWQSLEKPLVYTRDFLNIFKPFQSLNKELLVLNLDKKSDKINDLSDKDFLLSLIKDLKQYDIKSILIAINGIDDRTASEIEIESNLGSNGFKKNVKVSKLQDLHNIKKSQGKNYFIINTKLPYRKYSAADFVTRKIKESKFTNKKIIITSDYDSKAFRNKKLNPILKNAAGRWTEYASTHPAVLFILCALFGVGSVIVVFWARMLLVAAALALSFIITQLAYSLWGVYIETSTLIFSFVSIGLLAGIADFKAENFGSQVETLFEKLSDFTKSRQKQESFEHFPQTEKPQQAESIPVSYLQQQEPQNETLASVKTNSATSFDLKQNFEPKSNTQSSVPSTQQVMNSASKILEKTADSKELRAKFYCEQESTLESIALDFQESTVTKLTDLHSKISELLTAPDVNERTKTHLKIIQYDFNKTIDEFDTLLFNLVPFKFESGQGLLDSLQILAQKQSHLNKGIPRIEINSRIPMLKFDLDYKVNVYRIIQKLIDIIIESNRGEATFSNISIDIDYQDPINRVVFFKLNYDGKPVDGSTTDYRLMEIYKRASSINLDISFDTPGVEANRLVNCVELLVKTRAYSAVS